MAEKKKSSPKRAEARAASRRRGEVRHLANTQANNQQYAVNLVALQATSTVLLSSVHQTYGPTTKQYGKSKRPSKVLRAVRRATDPKVAAKRAAHIATS